MGCLGKLLKCHLKGKTCMDSILIILKKKKWPKGFICPYTGTIFYNIRIYSSSQVSVYRTIGPLVLISDQNQNDLRAGSNDAHAQKQQNQNRFKSTTSILLRFIAKNCR